MTFFRFFMPFVSSPGALINVSGSDYLDVARRCRWKTWQSSVIYSRLQLDSPPSLRLRALPLGSVAMDDVVASARRGGGAANILACQIPPLGGRFPYWTSQRVNNTGEKRR